MTYFYHETFHIIEPFLNERSIILGYRSHNEVYAYHEMWWSGPRRMKIEGTTLTADSKKFDLHDPESLPKIVEHLHEVGEKTGQLYSRLSPCMKG
jgi:hypothetical protein